MDYNLVKIIDSEKKYELINLYLNKDNSLVLHINKYILITCSLVVVILIVKFLYNKHKSNEWEVDEVTIKCKGVESKIKPNYKDMQICYKLWVELYTRKIGLKIDWENDVIEEVYNSWYEFFRISRNLINEIPVSKVRNNESTQQIVNLSIDVLNEGLRPHLTKWQARFRNWYKYKLEKETEINYIFPQDIQKQFPDYTVLVNDMKVVNEKLITYRDTLKNLYMAGAKINKLN